MDVLWEKFDDFFTLYESRGMEPRIVYVIGESSYCYIGSVGCRGGKGGLKARYEWQYIKRARAIFGQASPINQPAYVGFISSSYKEADIADLELHVQKIFIEVKGSEAAEFRPPKKLCMNSFVHRGELPLFIEAGPHSRKQVQK